MHQVVEQPQPQQQPVSESPIWPVPMPGQDLPITVPEILIIEEEPPLPPSPLAKHHHGHHHHHHHGGHHSNQGVVIVYKWQLTLIKVQYCSNIHKMLYTLGEMPGDTTEEKNPHCWHDPMSICRKTLSRSCPSISRQGLEPKHLLNTKCFRYWSTRTHLVFSWLANTYVGHIYVYLHAESITICCPPNARSLLIDGLALITTSGCLSPRLGPTTGPLSWVLLNSYIFFSFRV